MFISGAAHEYGGWGSEIAQHFIHELSKQIIKTNHKIVSGFGLGVGSAVISGALEQIYMNSQTNKSDRLVLRPFPQQVFGVIDRSEVWRRYREDMISYAGIAIFMFGNKLEGESVVASNGMRQEFDIAKEKGLVLLPIGATGYISEELWSEALMDLQNRFGSKGDVFTLYQRLGDKSATPEQLVEVVINLLEQLNK